MDKCVTAERLSFNRMMQSEDESFIDYLTKIVNQAKKCGYGTNEDSIVRDKILSGIWNDELRLELLKQGDLSLGQAIVICIKFSGGVTSSQLVDLSQPTTNQGTRTPPPGFIMPHIRQEVRDQSMMQTNAAQNFLQQQQQQNFIHYQQMQHANMSQPFNGGLNPLNNQMMWFQPMQNLPLRSMPPNMICQRPQVLQTNNAPAVSQRNLDVKNAPTQFTGQNLFHFGYPPQNSKMAYVTQNPVFNQKIIPNSDVTELKEEVKENESPNSNESSVSGSSEKAENSEDEIESDSNDEVKDDTSDEGTSCIKSKEINKKLNPKNDVPESLQKPNENKTGSKQTNELADRIGPILKEIRKKKEGLFVPVVENKAANVRRMYTFPAPEPSQTVLPELKNLDESTIEIENQMKTNKVVDRFTPSRKVLNHEELRKKVRDRLNAMVAHQNIEVIERPALSQRSQEELQEFGKDSLDALATDNNSIVTNPPTVSSPEHVLKNLHENRFEIENLGKTNEVGETNDPLNFINDEEFREKVRDRLDAMLLDQNIVVGRPTSSRKTQEDQKFLKDGLDAMAIEKKSIVVTPPILSPTEQPIIDYLEGQWSPKNLNGKKFYTFHQLMKIREDKRTRIRPIMAYNGSALLIGMKRKTNYNPLKEEKLSTYRPAVNYLDGQWSPKNLDGKKFYTLEQLMQISEDFQSKIRPRILYRGPVFLFKMRAPKLHKKKTTESVSTDTEPDDEFSVKLSKLKIANCDISETKM